MTSPRASSLLLQTAPVIPTASSWRRSPGASRANWRTIAGLGRGSGRRWKRSDGACALVMHLARR